MFQCTKQVVGVYYLNFINFLFLSPLTNTIHAISYVEVSTELLLFISNNLSINHNLIIIDAAHLYLFLNKSRCFFND